MYKSTETKRKTVILRSMSVTLVIMLLSLAGLYFAGQVFEVTEKTAFGREAEAFGIVGYDRAVFFGKEYTVPFNTVFDSLKELYQKLCSPILKLLKTAVFGFKELVEKIIQVSFF